MYMRCLYVLHNVCGKLLSNCGKVSLIVVTNPLTNALWKCTQVL